MTDDELAEIWVRWAEARAMRAADLGKCDCDECAECRDTWRYVEDIDALIAEVKRLRGEADSWENMYTEHMEQCG